jgi:hypothetical protein
VDLKKSSTYKKKDLPPELLALMNIGPAMCGDLVVLGIKTVCDLAKADPDELYIRLQQITGAYHDPCVWDVFAASIHEARTGEKQPWWAWTRVRKERQADGSFVSS